MFILLGEDNGLKGCAARTGWRRLTALDPVALAQSVAMMPCGPFPVRRRECHFYLACRVSFLSCADKPAGGWLSGVFGTLPADLVGLAGADWVHEKRRRVIAQLQAKTAELIADLPPNRLTEPSPSLVLPLLQSAADEARPELQARWAALLANAMTDEGRNVRRAFFETLAKMEPFDVVVLDLVANSGGSISAGLVVERAAAVGLSDREVVLSMNALLDLKCISLFGGEGFTHMEYLQRYLPTISARRLFRRARRPNGLPHKPLYGNRTAPGSECQGKSQSEGETNDPVCRQFGRAGPSRFNVRCHE